MEPIVTLVVVSYNCKEWLPRFFESLKQQTIFPRCEVLLVDNSSKDGTAEVCAEEMKSWSNGRFLPTGGNYGFGGGCNFGARQARGKFLFFMNPDVWFERDCLEALVRQAESAPVKAFFALEMPYESEAFDPANHSQGVPGFDIFGCMTAQSTKENLDRLFAPGSFFFIERDLFQKIGQFDREFFVYGEEMDMSWRIRIAGESIEVVRAALLHHAGATSSDEAARTSEFRRFYANRNQILLLAKNAHGPLLLLIFTHIALIAVETLAGAILARNISFIKATFFQALADCWRLRGYIFEERRRIRGYRRRGDLWIARHFFRFTFGHWQDIKRFLKWKIEVQKSPLPASTKSPTTGNHQP